MKNEKYRRNILKKVRQGTLWVFKANYMDDGFQIKRNWYGSSGGKEFHLLVTPRVKEEARAHFDCPTLEGAELHTKERAILKIRKLYLRNKMIFT